MKKSKYNSLLKKAQKSLRKDIELSLSEILKTSLEGLENKKKAKKAAMKGLRKLAKRVSKAVRFSKDDLIQKQEAAETDTKALITANPEPAPQKRNIVRKTMAVKTTTASPAATKAAVRQIKRTVSPAQPAAFEAENESKGFSSGDF